MTSTANTRFAAMKRAKGPGPAAFTLTEMLIAIGIMGVGLTLVTAMFPTGIKQQAMTVQDTIGLQVCNNALAVAKAAVKHPLCNGPHTPNPPMLLGEPCHSTGGLTDATKNWVVNQWRNHYVYAIVGTEWGFVKITGNTKDTLTAPGASPGPTGEFHILGYSEAIDGQYPMPANYDPVNGIRSNFGWTVLFRPMKSTSVNKYQFAAISYKRLSSNADVALTPLKVTAYNGDDMITVENQDTVNFVPGSPVIDLETGRYSYVYRLESSDGLKARLTHPLFEVEGTGSLAGAQLRDTTSVEGQPVKQTWLPGQWTMPNIGFWKAQVGSNWYDITANGVDTFDIANGPANGQCSYRVFHSPKWVAVLHEYDSNNNPVGSRSPVMSVLISQGAAKP